MILNKQIIYNSLTSVDANLMKVNRRVTISFARIGSASNGIASLDKKENLVPVGVISLTNNIQAELLYSIDTADYVKFTKWDGTNAGAVQVELYALYYDTSSGIA